MSSGTSHIGSVLDTNRNIESFLDTPPDDSKQYKSYLSSLYRVMNLTTADMLEALVFGVDISVYKRFNRSEKQYKRAEILGVRESTLISDYDGDKKIVKAAIRGHKEGYIIKTVMDLRGCSRMATLAKDDRGLAYISSTSDKCRNKYCFICNRSRSQKFTGRFVRLIEMKFSDFRKYRFYFLTLTLVHNNKVRKGDYLKELKGYVGKLFRSKMFRDQVRPAEGESKIGSIRSYENKVGLNGNHIHVHILLMCDKIGKVAEVEKKIREWWIKKTKVSGEESNQIRLDLIGKGLGSGDWSDFLGSVREVMKYSTKFNDTNAVSNKEVKILGDWMKSSKGKNFKTATGLFSGYQLTSHKSSLDEEIEKEEKVPRYVASTTGLSYKNKKYGRLSLKKKYTKEERAVLKDDIKLVAGSVVELAEVYDDYEMRDILNSNNLRSVQEKIVEIDKHRVESEEWERQAMEAKNKMLQERQDWLMSQKGMERDEHGFYVPIVTK